MRTTKTFMTGVAPSQVRGGCVDGSKPLLPQSFFQGSSAGSSQPQPPHVNNIGGECLQDLPPVGSRGNSASNRKVTALSTKGRQTQQSGGRYCQVRRNPSTHSRINRNWQRDGLLIRGCQSPSWFESRCESKASQSVALHTGLSVWEDSNMLK